MDDHRREQAQCNSADTSIAFPVILNREGAIWLESVFEVKS